MDRKGTSRNDPCPCGSGKKFKDCCLRKEVEARSHDPSPKLTDLHGKLKDRPEFPIGTVALYGPTTRSRPRSPPG
jgi:SEC-C motif